jgi:replicative DNA helicase
MTETSTDPNAQNERALLGCLLYDPGIGIDAAMLHGITQFSFAVEAHRTIYAAILDMWKRTGICEPYALQRAVTLEGVTDHNIIQTIADECLTVAYAPYYATKVREQEKRRALRRIAQKIMAVTEDDDLGESIVEAESSLTALYGTTQSKATMAEVAAQTCEQWDATATGGKSKGIPSRFLKLNQIIGGYSEYTILAARPSQGKSLLMLNEALSMCCAGLRVGIASVEMTTRQCLGRMACDYADVNYFTIENGYSSPEQLARAKEKAMREAIEAVNKSVNLNVKLDIDVKFGENYASVH